MPERPRPFELSGISYFGVAFSGASSQNGSRESSRQFRKESPRRQRSEINRSGFSGCFGAPSATIVSAAWLQPLTSCKPLDVIFTHQRVRRRKPKLTHGVGKNDESLEYRDRRSSSASRIGRCLCVECISGASHEAIWLGYFRSHTDLHHQHLCVGYRGFFRWPLAQSCGTKSRRAHRRISVWPRSFSGEFLRPQTVVTISKLRCDWRNWFGLQLHCASCGPG